MGYLRPSHYMVRGMGNAKAGGGETLPFRQPIPALFYAAQEERVNSFEQTRRLELPVARFLGCSETRSPDTNIKIVVIPETGACENTIMGILPGSLEASSDCRAGNRMRAARLARQRDPLLYMKDGQLRIRRTGGAPSTQGIRRSHPSPGRIERAAFIWVIYLDDSTTDRLADCQADQLVNVPDSLPFSVSARPTVADELLQGALRNAPDSAQFDRPKFSFANPFADRNPPNTVLLCNLRRREEFLFHYRASYRL